MVNAKEVGETTTPSDVSKCFFAICNPAFCGSLQMFTCTLLGL